MNEITNLETALTAFQPKKLPTSYELSYVTAKGETKSKTLTKAENIRLMTTVDAVERTGKRLDIARCLLFASIDRGLNADNSLGISTRDLIMQKYHLSKSTANQYLSIGKKFFTNVGTEKVYGILAFTVGQVIPFLAFVNDFPVIGGTETSYDFLSWLIYNGFISSDMSADELAGIAKLLKDGYVPKEWVAITTDPIHPFVIFAKNPKEESDTAKNAKYENDIEFTLCPYLDTVIVENIDSEKGDNSDSEKGDTTKPESESISTIVRRMLSTVSDCPMPEELRSKWSEESETLLKLVIDIEKAMSIEEMDVAKSDK